MCVRRCGGMLSQGKLDALRLLLSLRPVTFNLDPLKLVPPGTHFSEIFRPTLTNLFPL